MDEHLQPCRRRYYCCDLATLKPCYGRRDEFTAPHRQAVRGIASSSSCDVRFPSIAAEKRTSKGGPLCASSRHLAASFDHLVGAGE